MAKTTGLGDRLYIDGYDLSGDICAIETIACPMNTLESTGIDKSAMERLGGLRDGQMEFMSYFNPTAGQAHDRLSILPTSDIVLTYGRGTTLGDPCASLVAKEVTYDGERADDGAFTFQVSAQANGFGLDWGVQMTPGIRTESTATDGPSVDFGTGSTAFGLQAFVHVTALGSGTPTIKIQESSDDGVGDAFVDVTGGTFGVVTANTAARIETSRTQTVERYLRVVTTGTFSGLSFFVHVQRNDSSTLF